MKVIVESCGKDASDEYFKHVVRTVLDQVMKSGRNDLFSGGGDIVFKCCPCPPSIVSLEKIVTVYHTEEVSILDSDLLLVIRNSIIGMGKRYHPQKVSKL